MSNKELKTIFALERRSFLKWSAVAGTAGMMMNFDEAIAAGECATTIDPKAPESVTAAMNREGLLDPASLSEGVKNRALAINREFYYWFDGPMVDGMASGGKFRGRLAVFLDMKLAGGEYLESCVFADSDRLILDERRFPGGAKGRTTGKPPYVIFDNIEVGKADYHVYFTIAKAGASSVLVYKYTIKAADVRMSRFDYSHLSKGAQADIIPEFLAEMKDAGHCLDAGGGMTKDHGLVTTPYQHSADLPLHIVRAHFQSMDNSGAFNILIEPMHGDASAGHYMRWFAVLDPVGRFLGLRRRDFNPAMVGHGDAEEKFNGRKLYRITQGVKFNDELGLKAKYDAKIDPIAGNVNITECPYVQVVTEDKQDAIARVTIRLR
jgi:hypothetical protein